MTSIPDNATTDDPELDAMRVVFGALKGLDEPAQQRVMDYVVRRLSLSRHESDPERLGSSFSPRQLAAEEALEETRNEPSPSRDESDGDLDGISPVAQKWMRRNGLTAGRISGLFSLGVDEIDLVAKSVPGKGKKDRMRNVVLLQGVAAYLGSGAPRATYDQIKEACGHYNAYDMANFAAYMKDLAAEVSGSKSAGYTLTSRGLTNATELIKQMAA